MKKHLSFLLLALATLGFVACSDVPAPYGIPTGPVSKVKVPPYSESFSTSLGKFQSVLQSGSGSWAISYSAATAKGYNSAQKATIEGNYYLISPEIDLTDIDTAHVSYDYIVGYNVADDNQRVLISCDYATKNKPADATWLLLKSKHETVSSIQSSTPFSHSDITIPKTMLGKIVRIAFAYNCVASGGSTWEVKNFCIDKGKGTEEPEDDGNKPIEFKDFCNGDCEIWTTDSLCYNWKSYSNATTAETCQSSDAHGGSYAIKVVGASIARRLAYYEMNLEAGTYNVSFYAKAATTDNAKLVPGYGIVTSKTEVNFNYDKTGTGSNNYVTVNNTEWTKVNYTFTLAAKSVVSLVIQNAKQGTKSRDLLIDDYTIEPVQAE